MPLPVLSVEEMRSWEASSWKAGATESEVIAQVGLSLANCILTQVPRVGRVLILAGPGNNGADARAAIPHLSHLQVEVLEASRTPPTNGAIEAALSKNPDLIVDGLFGIGLNRGLGSEWNPFFERIQDHGCRVLAVDVPSGLDANSGEVPGAAIRADLTLTVGTPKRGLVSSQALPWVGRLQVAHPVGLIGELPSGSELQWTLEEDFPDIRLLRSRKVDSHKGSFGQAVLIAGSLGYSGAAVLAARGAGCARPGLLSVLTPQECWLPISSQLAAAMVHPLSPDHPALSRATAILIGPGMADPRLDPTIRRQAIQLWIEFPGILVADASALDWLPECASHAGIRVVTPHPGEAARLLGMTSEQIQANRPAALRKIAEKLNAIVLLKGHQTLVGSAKGPIFINPVGNPGLSQGGTGDVLAGFLTGLLAQPGLASDPWTTCRLAAWVHGATADHLESQCGHWSAEQLALKLDPFRIHGQTRF